MQASKAIFPKAIMILTFLSKSISCLKYLKQVLSSKGVGLSPGGTHFKAVVT